MLQARGLGLRKLVLEGLFRADVGSIGVLCPDLEHLALANIRTFAPVVTDGGEGDGNANR